MSIDDDYERFLAALNDEILRIALRAPRVPRFDMPRPLFRGIGVDVSGATVRPERKAS